MSTARTVAEAVVDCRDNAIIRFAERAAQASAEQGIHDPTVVSAHVSAGRDARNGGNSFHHGCIAGEFR